MIRNPSFISESWEAHLRKNAVSLELNTPVHNTENAEWNKNQWFFLTTHPRTESPSKQHPQTRERQEITAKAGVTAKTWLPGEKLP